MPEERILIWPLFRTARTISNSYGYSPYYPLQDRDLIDPIFQIMPPRKIAAKRFQPPADAGRPPLSTISRFRMIIGDHLDMETIKHFVESMCHSRRLSAGSHLRYWGVRRSASRAGLVRGTDRADYLCRHPSCIFPAA